MSHPRRFLVVSTGQNVANLPPILEFGEAGDRVVWIESPEARDRNWSEGARGVLHDRGFLISRDADIHVSQINDPAQIRAAIQSASASWRPEEELFIVANGGQKLTPIGLYLGLQRRRSWFLYGNDRPVEWQRYPIDFGTLPERGFYRKQHLDLPDILRVTGHILSDTDQRPFWPGELPPQLHAERYGLENEYTRELHYDRWRSHREAQYECERIGYRELSHVLSEQRILQWKQSLPALLGPTK